MDSTGSAEIWLPKKVRVRRLPTMRTRSTTHGLFIPIPSGSTGNRDSASPMDVGLFETSKLREVQDTAPLIDEGIHVNDESEPSQCPIEMSSEGQRSSELGLSDSNGRSGSSIGHTVADEVAPKAMFRIPSSSDRDDLAIVPKHPMHIMDPLELLSYPYLPTGLAEIERDRSFSGACEPQDFQSTSPTTRLNRCQYCAAVFTLHHHLMDHMAIHSKERAFICSMCHSGLRGIHELESDKKFRTGGKPYTCLQCDRVFPLGEALMHHNKSSDGCTAEREVVEDVDSSDDWEDDSSNDDVVHKKPDGVDTYEIKEQIRAVKTANAAYCFLESPAHRSLAMNSPFTLPTRIPARKTGSNSVILCKEYQSPPSDAPDYIFSQLEMSNQPQESNSLTHSYQNTPEENRSVDSVDSGELTETWESRLEPTLRLLRLRLINELVESFINSQTSVNEIVDAASDGSQSSSSSTSQLEPSSGIQGQSSSANSASKRTLSGENDEEGQPDQAHRPRGKQLRTSAPQISLNGRLLACPYFKYDPIRYSDLNAVEKQYRRCSSIYLTTTSRLKQHLYRVHKRPDHYCPCCFEVFETHNSLNTHARARPVCELHAPEFEEKMTQNQVNEIKRRVVGKGPAHTWFAIFKVLFPGTPLPESPYADTVSPEVIKSFTDHFYRQARARLFGLFHSELQGRILLNTDQQNILDTALEGAIALLIEQAGEADPTGGDDPDMKDADNADNADHSPRLHLSNPVLVSTDAEFRRPMYHDPGDTGFYVGDAATYQQPLNFGTEVQGGCDDGGKEGSHENAGAAAGMGTQFDPEEFLNISWQPTGYLPPHSQESFSGDEMNEFTQFLKYNPE